MFERITEKTFDEIFPLLESAFPVTELRMKEEPARTAERAMLSALRRAQRRRVCGNLCDMGNRGFFIY